MEARASREALRSRYQIITPHEKVQGSGELVQEPHSRKEQVQDPFILEEKLQVLYIFEEQVLDPFERR